MELLVSLSIKQYNKIIYCISSGPHLASVDSEPAAATSLGGRGRSPMGQGGHLGGVVLVPHVVIASVFGTPSRAKPARNCQSLYEVSILAIHAF